MLLWSGTAFIRRLGFADSACGILKHEEIDLIAHSRVDQPRTGMSQSCDWSVSTSVCVSRREWPRPATAGPPSGTGLIGLRVTGATISLKFRQTSTYNLSSFPYELTLESQAASPSFLSNKPSQHPTVIVK